MLIREANILDAYEILNFWIELIEDTKPYGCKTDFIEQQRFLIHIMQRILKKDFIGVAEDNEQSVGFISAWMNDKTAFVDNIYLKKEFRQPELFLRFIKYAENKAKKDGAEYIRFDAVYNGRFEKVCRKLGFMPEKVKVVKCLS